MNILHINTADAGGGAEGSARKLVEQLQAKGHHAFLAVGQKFSDSPQVIEIPRSAPLPAKPILSLSNALRPYVRNVRGLYPLTRALDRLADPPRLKQFLAGLDETPYPQACRNLPYLCPELPDIIHCHNLHGWYFDLNALPALATVAPVIINLRDSWLLTGHCAYPLDCERWQTGCGNCPHLQAYPRCLKDRTAQNLRHKAQLVRQAHARLTAPSQWQADMVANSLLGDCPCKVIPNGIDTTVFRPGSAEEARRQLQLPLDQPVVMFAAAAKTSVFKDYDTLWKAARNLANQRPDCHFLCIGIAAPPATITLPHLHCVPYISDPQRMALHYQAADVFWHAAHAETFGKTVTEAMASGTIPIATNVGGIPEQIIPEKTGFLTGHQQPDDFVSYTLQVLEASPETRKGWRKQAAQRGEAFSLKRQTQAFLDWYGELIEDHRRISSS